MEIWIDIKGYEEIYQVSDLGNVKSLDRKRKNKQGLMLVKSKVLKHFPQWQGYRQVKLAKNNKEKTLYVHRLVGEAFLRRIKGKDYINHIDGNKTNNFKDNLEWVTFKENTRHAFDTGLRKAKSGESHSMSKLTEIQVLEIRKIFETNKVTKREISKMYNVTESNIGAIVSRRTWNHLNISL